MDKSNNETTTEKSTQESKTTLHDVDIAMIFAFIFFIMLVIACCGKVISSYTMQEKAITAIEQGYEVSVDGLKIDTDDIDDIHIFVSHHEVDSIDDEEKCVTLSTDNW